MKMIRLLLASTLAAALAGCGGGSHGDGGVGRDLGSVDLASTDAGCMADLAGSALQICGRPDASFDPHTCACAGDP